MLDRPCLSGPSPTSRVHCRDLGPFLFLWGPTVPPRLISSPQTGTGFGFSTMYSVTGGERGIQDPRAVSVRLLSRRGIL